MDAEYATRKRQLLEECQIAPEIFQQVMPRLATFMVPFVAPFCRQEPSQHAQTSVCGLLSDVARKNIASIAYRFGQDRLPLQRFIGWAEWDDAPLRQELTRQVAAQLGQAEGVLVFDPSAFAKSGAESVGVARQWCGRLGKVGVPHDRRRRRSRLQLALDMLPEPFTLPPPCCFAADDAMFRPFWFRL